MIVAILQLASEINSFRCFYIDQNAADMKNITYLHI